MLQKLYNKTFRPRFYYAFGIRLDKSLYLKIQERLKEIEEQAPYNSSIDLSFKKSRSKYLGKLQINSIQQCFDAEKFGVNPYQCYLKLEEDILKQIDIWKKNRKL